MSCHCQTSAAIPSKPSRRPLPCLPCAMEHLDLAQEAAECGMRHRAVWHLARAAELAPRTASALRAARLELQKNNRPVDWDKLRGSIA